jgi:hypothetical protein
MPTIGELIKAKLAERSPTEEAKAAPIRYQVRVMREHIVTLVPRRTRWEELYGSIVTPLPLEQYCAQHQLKLVELYAGTRPAHSLEKTELF